MLLGAMPPGSARFLRAVGYAEAVAPDRPLRLAYADPPHPGKARLYRDHPDYGGEVNHAELIDRLAAYDGWALSASAEALPAVLVPWRPGPRHHLRPDLGRVDQPPGPVCLCCRGLPVAYAGEMGELTHAGNPGSDARSYV